VESITRQLEDVAETASDIIKFLNSKDDYELEELRISDRTTTILEVKKMITNKNLILQLQEKCNNVNNIVQRFFNKIEPLVSKGLPSMMVINDKLMPIEDYVKKLTELGTHAASMAKIKGLVTPVLIVKPLRDSFFILVEIKHIFLVKPTFTKYTEMDEIYRRVTNISIPDNKRWEELTDLIN